MQIQSDANGQTGNRNKEQEAIDRFVASMPPLSHEQRDGLVALFHQVTR